MMALSLVKFKSYFKCYGTFFSGEGIQIRKEREERTNAGTTTKIYIVLSNVMKLYPSTLHENVVCIGKRRRIIGIWGQKSRWKPYLIDLNLLN